MQINYFGDKAEDCVANLFYWYYKKNILHQKWLDADPDIVAHVTRSVEDENTGTHWFATLTLGKYVIYFAWKVKREGPSDWVVDVVFTCDPALATSTESWEDLCVRCTHT
jgi:hypothetical protein